MTFTWKRAENKAPVSKSRFCWEGYLLVVTKLWTSLRKEIVRSDINSFVQNYEPLHERTYEAEESLSERLLAHIFYYTGAAPG